MPKNAYPEDLTEKEWKINKSRENPKYIPIALQEAKLGKITFWKLSLILLRNNFFFRGVVLKNFKIASIN